MQPGHLPAALALLAARVILAQAFGYGPSRQSLRLVEIESHCCRRRWSSVRWASVPQGEDRATITPQQAVKVEGEIEPSVRSEVRIGAAGGALIEPEEHIPGPESLRRTPAGFLRLIKRRLWTKADFLHSHAISGMAFMVLGVLYVLYFLADELLHGATLAHAEAGVIGWTPLAIMWAGVVNCASCLPMSKFSPGSVAGYDTKGAGFKGLGIGMTMLGIWMSYFFSGHYPSVIAPLDPVLALGFLVTIIHGIVNSEIALTRELTEKKLMMQNAVASESVARREQMAETRTEIVLNHRVASYPNLLHLPVLYNIITGGQAWAHQVTERFPLEPTLLFHASFGIAVANSIVFLGATLKDRKLMTLRQWLLLQVVVLIPFVTTIVDISTLGDAVSINPLQTYAGLMH